MKKQTRVLAALTLFLASGPLPAAAQIFTKSGPAAGSAAPAIPVLNSAAQPNTGSLTSPAGGLGLAGSLSSSVSAPLPSVGLVRLIVEPADPTAPHLGAEHRAAIEAGIKAEQARELKKLGASGIFESEVYLEAANPAAAARLTQALEAAGLRVTDLAQALAKIQSAAAAPAGSDEELKASAARLLEKNGAYDGAEALGAVLAAIEASDAPRFSDDARRKAALAIYSGLGPISNAFSAIRGDREAAARQKFRASHPETNDSINSIPEMVRAGHVAYQEPELRAAVEPLRALTLRAAQAIERLDLPAATPLLLTLLPHAGNAYHDAVRSDPARAQKLLSGWIDYLRHSLNETIRLYGEPGSHNYRGSFSFSEFIAEQRTSVFSYDPKTTTLDPDHMKGEYGPVWALFASAPAAVRQAASRAFLQLLSDAELPIARLSAKQRRAHISEQLARAELYIPSSNIDEETRRSMVESIVEDRLSQYDRYDRIEGERTLDGVMIALGWVLNSHTELIPGFDVNIFLTDSARLLNAVTGMRLNTFKVAAESALMLVHYVRHSINPDLTPDTRRAVEELGTAVLSRVEKEGIQLYRRP